MSLDDVKVSEIMTSPVIKVSPKAPFSEVARLFMENTIRHLVVADPRGRLVGIMSKRDLYRTVSPRKGLDKNLSYFRDKVVETTGAYYMKESLDEYILANIMIKRVRNLKSNESVKSALHKIVKEQIGCVVIVDDEKKVVGIVTRGDILKFIDEK